MFFCRAENSRPQIDTDINLWTQRQDRYLFPCLFLSNRQFWSGNGKTASDNTLKGKKIGHGDRKAAQIPH